MKKNLKIRVANHVSVECSAMLTFRGLPVIMGFFMSKKFINWCNENEGFGIYLLVVIEILYLLTHLNK